jgi:hypothetical protein
MRIYKFKLVLIHCGYYNITHYNNAMQYFDFSYFIFLLLFSIAEKVAKKSSPDEIFNNHRNQLRKTSNAKTTAVPYGTAVVYVNYLVLKITPIIHYIPSVIVNYISKN